MSTTKRVEFKTNWNSRERELITEPNRFPSKTVPDDTLTIAQIVKNHMHKLPTNARTKEGIYLGDEEYFDLQNLDNIDKQDMLQAAQAEINAIRSEHTEKQKLKKQQQDLKKDPPTSTKEDGGTPPVDPAQPKPSSGA